MQQAINADYLVCIRRLRMVISSRFQRKCDNISMSFFTDTFYKQKIYQALVIAEIVESVKAKCDIIVVRTETQCLTQ